MIPTMKQIITNMFVDSQVWATVAKNIRLQNVKLTLNTPETPLMFPETVLKGPWKPPSLGPWNIESVKFLEMTPRTVSEILKNPLNAPETSTNTFKHI